MSETESVTKLCNEIVSRNSFYLKPLLARSFSFYIDFRPAEGSEARTDAASIEAPPEERKTEAMGTTTTASSTASRSAEAKEGGRHVLLHPLAIVGVSDHLTRVKLGGSKQPRTAPVMGLLFGTQSDSLAVSICDATEVAYDEKTLKMDEAFLRKQVELYTAVYKDKELLGWYAVAPRAGPEHLALHKDFLKFNEAPLFLMMDPAGASAQDDKKSLPISIFEYELHVVDDAPTMLFVDVPYALETLQAEQIAMESVTKNRSGTSETAAVYESLDQSLKTLSKRVERLASYLKLVQAGAVPVDYAVLRDVANLVDKLPSLAPSPGLQAEYLRDLNDSLAVAYLAAITKNAALVHDIVDTFSLIHNAHHHQHHHHPSKLG